MNDSHGPKAAGIQRDRRAVKCCGIGNDDIQPRFLSPSGFHCLRRSLGADGRGTAFRDPLRHSARGQSPTARPLSAEEFPAKFVHNLGSASLRLRRTDARPRAAPRSNALGLVFQSLIDELIACGEARSREVSQAPLLSERRAPRKSAEPAGSGPGIRLQRHDRVYGVGARKSGLGANATLPKGHRPGESRSITAISVFCRGVQATVAGRRPAHGGKVGVGDGG